jgi:phospholipid/cholesterol/gamma-HCH transport system ATP-binding protein
MRQILGLERMSGGSIEMWGKPLADFFERSRRVGVMFQDGALFSRLTLLENVETPFKEHTHVQPQLMSELAALKLVMAGLSADSHHLKPAQISGGMRKRAALARALALDPELLMLDEPTSGLDPVTAARFDELLSDLAKALNLTVFLVTHDLDTVYETADRIAVVYRGKVAAIGPLEEVAASDIAWVRDYFRGPRGRAARSAHVR